MAAHSDSELSRQEIEKEFESAHLWMARRLDKTSGNEQPDWGFEHDLSEKLTAITHRPDYKPRYGKTPDGQLSIKLYDEGPTSVYSTKELEELGQGKGVSAGKTALELYLKDHPSQFFTTGDKPQVKQMLPAK